MLLTRFKRTVLLSLLHSLYGLVAAQNCYYPNGDLSTSDAPCSSEGSGAACCPLNWQCLDNGLCYLDNEQYFGRYTCTDKTWQSSACPRFCTDQNTDAGDQAVLQCANHGGQYCCDHNRDVNNVCCDQSDDSLFFALPKGNPTASIAKLGTPAAASGGGSNNNNFAPASSSSPQAFPQTSNSPTTSGSIPTVATFDEPPTAFSSPVSTTQSTPRPFAHSPSSSSSSTSTLIHSSTASASGRTSIVLLTSFITTPVSSPETASPAHPAASPSSSSSHHTSSNAAAIGGGVGGGVAVLLLASLIAFFLLRHRKRRKQRELQDATMQRPQTFLADQKDVGGLDYMYKGQDQGTPSTAQEGSPELDGTEIGGFGRRGVGERRPGEATRVGRGEGLGVTEGGGGGGGGEGGEPRDKWERYELAADGRL